MAEYKDVEQVKKVLRELCGGCWNRNSPSKCPDDCGVIETIRLLDSVPTVDAVPREIEQANKQAAYVKGYEDGQKDKYGRWGDAIEVVHGRWIGDAYSLRCSACGHDLMDYFSYTEEGQIIEQPNFCPHCKADMRKGNSDG